MSEKTQNEQNLEILISSFRIWQEALENIFASANETAQAMEALSSKVSKAAVDVHNSICQLQGEKTTLLAELDIHTAAGDEEKRLDTMDRLKKLNKSLDQKKMQGFMPPIDLSIQFEKIKSSLPTTEQLNAMIAEAIKFRDSGQFVLGRIMVFSEMIAGYRNKKLTV